VKAAVVIQREWQATQIQVKAAVIIPRKWQATQIQVKAAVTIPQQFGVKGVTYFVGQ
jgi:hypothetical protein